MTPETEALIRASIVADVMRMGEGIYWRRRAAQFLAIRPREGDYFGASSIEDQRERWHRLTEMARACEARAVVAEMGGAP